MQKRNGNMALFIASLAAAVCAAPLYSQAQKPTSGLTPVEGLENWKQVLDLSGYAPGKYNLVVEGRDKAGNITRAAPMNIFVDPKSDLPIASIINPTPLMRVGGDLHIVGTAMDDDGVAKVEISLDGGEYFAAEGAEFWSFDLKTANIAEGRRKLDVRAVDVNGLAGPSVSVSFDLDRTKPLATVEGPAMGSLVSGQIRLTGSVFDANGVRSLEITRDGGATWEEVSIKTSRDKLRASFSWPVDTRKLPDGPRVFGLRSADMVGSVSVGAYLIVVDNTAPAIEVARPEAGKAVNGRFSLAGAVRDAVGVKRLSYELGSGEKGDIALTKGNPFFVKELDIGSVKGDSTSLVLVAEDNIGNLTKISVPVKIDHRADMPVLKLLGPQVSGSGASASARLREGELLWGSISDDDGVSALTWSLDGSAPVQVPCSETFSLLLPPTSPGRHLLSLVPLDSNGLAGDPVAVALAVDKGPGAIAFERLVSAKEGRDFVPGIEVSVDSAESLEGSIAAPNPIASAEYSIAEGKAKPLALEKPEASGALRFRISLDASLPYGFAPISVRAKDQAGNEFRAEALLYVTNYSVAREEAGFRFPDPRIGEGGRIALGKVPLVGAFYGGELASLRFDPPTDLVAAGFDGRAVSIAPVKEGTTVPTRILGKTKQGREFASGPFVFVTEAAPPLLKLDAPAEGTSFNAKLAVKGSATNALGPATLSWRRLPDGERKPVELGPGGSFSFELSAAELPAGPLSIELEAKNPAGLVAHAYRSLVADAKGPALTFLAPEKGAAVWGPEDVAARIESASGIRSLEFAADGKSFAAIEAKGSYFAHRADFAANPAALYRARDRAGNEATFRPEVKIEAAPQRPAASAAVSVEPAAGEARVELAGAAGTLKSSLLLPGLSEADYAALGEGDAPPPARFATRLLVQGALSLKGQAAVEGKAKAVSLSTDGGATWRALASNKDAKSAKASLPFSFSVEAAKLPVGAARWAIKVEDFEGASYYCPLYCLFDAKPPSLAVLSPAEGLAALPGAFPLVIKAEDENGLGSFELGVGAGAAKESLDAAAGGRYFVRMLDPSVVPKGAPLQVFLSAKDAAGNLAALSPKYGYDAAADAPKLREDSLVAELGGLVSGLASDDDGAPALRASIDGGEALAFPTGAYAFALPPLSVGKHVLAIEIEGAAAPVKHEFSIKDEAPVTGDFKFVSGKSSSSWSPGVELQLAVGSVFSGVASSSNGLGGVSIAFNGGASLAATLSKAVPGSAQAFSVPVPAGLPYGRVSIEIEVKDSMGQTSLRRIELHKVLPPASGSDDGEGIRFSDARIAQVEGLRSILLAPGEKLQGRFNGRPIRSVTINPATSFLEAGFDGALISVTAKAEGLLPQASLELTTVDGDLFSWAFAASVDSGPPVLELSSPADGDWLKGEFRAAGKASDPQGVALLQVSVNGGDPVSLLGPSAPGAAAATAAAASFDKLIPLASAPDGSTRIDFLARDGAGRETRASRFINKDTIAPSLAQVLPVPGESVNGLTTFIGEATDSGRLASVVFLAPAEKKAEEAAAAKAEEPKAGKTMEDWIQEAMRGPKPKAAESKAAEPKAIETKAEEVTGLASFSRDLDLARLLMPLPEGCGFAVTDKAGNRALLSPTVVVDKEKDKPVAEIHTPAELEVLRGDFLIGGVAYDDDGLAAAYYRIDGGAWTRLEVQGMSFSIPIALKDTTDNEHLVELKAEDIYGVQSDVVARKYRISKEEPLAKLLSPAITKPVRGTIKLEGSASDANGVKDANVSVDNRISYDKPLGAESWSIALDTTTLSDGIHAVAVRPVDGYDTEGFYASMLTIDNTPPRAQMDLPRDGEEVAAALFVSGRISDNLAIASSRIEIAPIGGDSPPAIVLDLGDDKIVQRGIDVSALKPGVYAVRLVVRDRADNESLASRDVRVVAAAPLDSVTILFPVEGARLSGKLRVQGRASVASGAQTVSILADGAVLGAAEPDALGWYSLDVPAGALSDGDHVLRARTSAKDGRLVESPDARLEWNSLGPWVSIESFHSGKYLEYRPYLKGEAGWAVEEVPEGSLKGDKKALEEYKKAAKGREIAAVDVSLDDGRTFSPAKGKEKWSFRLETQDFKEGALHAIVRARYADGTIADAKGLYFLDKTPPEVQLLAPSEGGRFNGSLELEGRSFDSNGMATVGVALRKGDKSKYELPAFIQGLYLDGQMLGATTWQTGVGLTFFGDNVKVQALYGKAPETDASGVAESFFGDVIGGKLIANVAYLPFGSFFGPDWDFLSAAFGLGANFSYFSKTQSGSGLIVGSVFGQLEFPKITFRNMSVFKKVSLYTEYQLWVLSSVIEGGFIQKLSFGARLGIF